MRLQHGPQIMYEHGKRQHRSVKAITLWEPWASLVLVQEKKVETRCWSTKYRGPLAIHAAAKSPPQWLGASRHDSEFQRRLGIVEKKYGWQNHWWKETAGKILCIVNLVEVEEADPRKVDDQERWFGNYEAGRYMFHLEFVERFIAPIPAKGNRMLWNWERP
jgi:hypothetical protein